MRLSAILIILLGIILLLSSNVFALNFNDQADKYSLSSCSLPFATKELDGHINLASNSMIHRSPSLIKFNNPYGIIDDINHNLINIPNNHSETRNGYIFTDKVSEYLISRLSSLKINNKLNSKTSLICNPELLLDFYLNREVRPVWVTQKGLNNKAEILIKTIQEADQEGLNIETYHQDDISTLLTDIKLSIVVDTPEPAKFAELDLLLTDAFFSYGFHLSEGTVDPYSNNYDWYIKKPKKNLAKILQKILYTDKLKRLVDELQPRHFGYLRLKLALLKHQKIKQSNRWHGIPAGVKMRKGDCGKRIAALRSLLIILGDLKETHNNNQEYFDEALEDGVKKFQARHGLKIDGIVGSKTLATLNVPVEDRIRQISLNMERWRWLPQDLGESHLVVNTANFELNIIKDDQTIKSIRAIVGKMKRPTPVLSRKITYLELNPYWNVPHKIALNDILPSIKKDPNYLADKNIRIFENWKADAREVNSESIDWSAITKKNFIYKLRQDPVNSNALGCVKFIFPNEFSIYLHDTPDRELFNMTKRTFSSGCIRIEEPVELAAYLLQENTSWDLEKLITVVNSRKTEKITLPDPINIHILYWTAWVDQDGTINFRDDIYERDSQLNIALNEKATYPGLLYGENTTKHIFSSQILPKSKPPGINMNKIGARVVSNSSGL